MLIKIEKLTVESMLGVDAQVHWMHDDDEVTEIELIIARVGGVVVVQSSHWDDFFLQW